MRPVVADTNILLKAFLSPNGRRRKFLVVCAYGALNYYVRVGLAERERLQEELEHVAASAIGGVDIHRFIEAAADRHAFLAEHLPAMTPDDLCLVASRPLLDEVEEKVADVGPQMLRGDMPDDTPAKVRRQLVALSAIMVQEFDPADVSEHTAGRDRDDDLIIETALLGQAIALVADDKKHIALSEQGTTYRHPVTGAEIVAYQFEPFVVDLVNTYHFDLDDVPGALLSSALEGPATG
jgi:predicted nucleic acid-binding protein